MTTIWSRQNATVDQFEKRKRSLIGPDSVISFSQVHTFESASSSVAVTSLIVPGRECLYTKSDAKLVLLLDSTATVRPGRRRI